MRRDTQIGILLGIVILVVIGVFLSTRTSYKETELPDLILSEEGTEEPEIEVIDITELSKRSKAEVTEKIAPVETFSGEKPVNANNEYPTVALQEKSSEEKLPEADKDNTSLEGKWEGVAEEITEEEEIIEEPETVVESDTGEKSKTEETVRTSDLTQHISTSGVSGKTVHKVKSNDSLIKIARQYYKDETKWTEIFEANKDTMTNPNALYVGQELLIPDIKTAKSEKPGTEIPVKKQINYQYENTFTHTVETGDSLYKLARKYYDDPALWDRIYEANKATIQDKELLIKGQVLIIPKK